MSVAKKVDLVIEQGKTFQRTVRWETSPRVWKAISGITNAAPAVVNATTHGLLDGWRAAVVNVLGMLDINAANNPPRDADLKPVAYIDANHVSFDLSAAAFDAYTSGGYLVYWTPHDLAGYTARMKIKDRVGGTVLEVVTATPDNTTKTIALLISDVDSAAFSWVRGVYDLELVSPGGIVTAILSGSITVVKEVTT